MLNFEPITPETLSALCTQLGIDPAEGAGAAAFAPEGPCSGAAAAGCLLLQADTEEGRVFAPPVPGPAGDWEQALRAVEDVCMEEGFAPAFFGISAQNLTGLLERYPYTRVRACVRAGERRYALRARSELEIYVPRLPEVKTQRLTLTELRERDIPAYQALVLDAERNRWWGYDDAADFPEPRAADAFYRAAQEEFARHREASFAVRHSDAFIGEVVLHHFNCRGEAELGCRISTAYAGFGYGTEAFAAAADWAIRALRLTRLRAKCFRENQPSRRMLASCMHADGEDETYFHFSREI